MERQTDHGTLIVTYEKDGTVTVRGRSPGETNESKVNLPLAIWRSLITEPSQKP
jgi:formylmethanofuran dehydrogenase subunit D